MFARCALLKINDLKFQFKVDKVKLNEFLTYINAAPNIT